MPSAPPMRGLSRLAENAGFLWRLLLFDLFVGRRTGVVKVGRGVSCSGDVGISLGARVFLGRYGIFQGTGAVSIGARTYIGNFFNMNCRSSISIGENCMFGNFVTLVDNNHGAEPGADMIDQPFDSAPIVVERNCWLGEKVTVLAGVTIGENSIVAAGSVVTRSVPPDSVVAGVPAKLVRSRRRAVASSTCAPHWG